MYGQVSLSSQCHERPRGDGHAEVDQHEVYEDARDALRSSAHRFGRQAEREHERGEKQVRQCERHDNNVWPCPQSAVRHIQIHHAQVAANTDEVDDK